MTFAWARALLEISPVASWWTGLLLGVFFWGRGAAFAGERGNSIAVWFVRVGHGLGKRHFNTDMV